QRTPEQSRFQTIDTFHHDGNKNSERGEAYECGSDEYPVAHTQHSSDKANGVVGQKWIESGNNHRPRAVIVQKDLHLLFGFLPDNLSYDGISKIAANQVADRRGSIDGSQNNETSPNRPVYQYPADH
ncbi:hypothetical protein LCGC14_1859520, partial [marine sediment metagenome]